MISVIFGYRIAGCIVRTSNVSIISVTCNITVMALKIILSNVNVTEKSQFFSTLYSTYKITNIYQQIKDLQMECPSTSTELSVCAVYRCTSWHFTGAWQVTGDRGLSCLVGGSSFLWVELSRTRHRLTVHDASYSSLRIRMKKLFIYV